MNTIPASCEEQDNFMLHFLIPLFSLKHYVVIKLIYGVDIWLQTGLAGNATLVLKSRCDVFTKLCNVILNEVEGGYMC